MVECTILKNTAESTYHRRRIQFNACFTEYPTLWHSEKNASPCSFYVSMDSLMILVCEG